jgi:hypothetical protein
MDAPQEEFYTREGADLLSDARVLLSNYRERGMGAAELAARLRLPDEYAAQAVLEALAIEGEVLA